jgi:hypothetical protein
MSETHHTRCIDLTEVLHCDQRTDVNIELRFF